MFGLDPVAEAPSLHLSPLGPGHHHLDVAAAAPGAEEAIAPSEDRDISAVPLGHLDRIRLDRMAAYVAPDNQPRRARRRCLPNSPGR